jgi:hypothetical protein
LKEVDIVEQDDKNNACEEQETQKGALRRIVAESAADLRRQAELKKQRESGKESDAT